MRLRRGRAGFTLLEMAFTMAVASMLLAAIAPAVERMLYNQLAERVGREVALIEDAAKMFFVDQHRWPTGFPELQTGGYLSATWTTQTPWGDPYAVSSTTDTFMVTVGVPTGLEGNLQRLVVTPTIVPLGDRAMVTSAVPVPGRESANRMLIKRVGDSVFGDVGLDSASLVVGKDGSPLYRVGVDAAGNFIVLDATTSVVRLIIDSTGHVVMGGPENIGGLMNVDGTICTDSSCGTSGSFSCPDGSPLTFQNGLLIGGCS